MEHLAYEREREVCLLELVQRITRDISTLAPPEEFTRDGVTFWLAAVWEGYVLQPEQAEEPL